MMALQTARFAGIAARPAARPAARRTAKVAVRASTEPINTEAAATEAAPEVPAAAAPISAPAPPPPPPVAAVAAPGLTEAMAFAGPAPEIINGRLAMLAMVSAIGAELSSGQSVGTQAFFDGDFQWVAFFSVLFAGASLVPILRGVKNEAFGPFTPQAEMLNGRVAMLGFAGLLIAEAVRGSALL